MVTRNFEKYGVYLGLIVIIPFLFNWITVPNISLTVLSIFFGGLLSIYLILPTIQHFEQFKFIIESGHIKDLIDYIRLPVILSLSLIILDLIKNSLNVILPNWLIILYNTIYLGLWGIFILSLIRIIIILPKILLNELNKNGKK
ncbi:hypothetical protein HN947_00275 [Candidatus Woesearchaeota archaeon]|jgi:hypothetical protein|nr:hypothetical protein [Candidatus Woesearchaeota archaeon]MBT6837684.1 hypothetical protein [Bacteroidota bacterium]MBT7148554.1 hypothetical protein [Candidatus Woesearchaeota archaeon]MBT7380073.1 hypothetical protein [archaeon]